MFFKKKNTAGRPPIIIRNIQTSKGVVEYNIYDFLKEMKNKPVIWNRMHIDHRNGVILEKNWIIFSGIFVPFLEQLDEDEKTKIIDELKDYWSQLKTNLMSTILAAQKGKCHQCHYLHYMEFFLNSKKRYLKDIATEEELQQLVDNEIKFRAIIGLPPPTKANDNRTQQNKRTGNKKVISKTSPKQSVSNRAIVDISPANPCDQMAMYETNSQQTTDDEAAVLENGIKSTICFHAQPQSTNKSLPRFPNECNTIVSSDLTNKSDASNQAFFDSIKPTLRNLNDSQKLDFKIEILKTLKKYKLN